MMNAFSGEKLEELREQIKTVFEKSIENIECSKMVEHDLNKITNEFFAKFTCQYIFNRDVSADKITVNV